MRRLPLIALMLLIFSAAARAADPPTLAVDRNSLFLGESVTVTIRVPGDQGQTPDLSGLPNARSRLMGPAQYQSFHSFSIGGGRRQSSGFTGMIYQFAVEPLKEGDYPGGLIKVKSGNQSYDLAFPPLTVMPIPPQDDVRLDLLADPAQVLPDDTFTVTLRLRVRRLDPPVADIVPFLPDDPPLLVLPYLEGNPIEGLDPPDLPALFQSWRQTGQNGGVAIQSQVAPSQDPFGMGGLFSDPFFGRGGRPTYLPQRRNIDLDGKPFLEYLFQTTFTAREEGIYSFGPGTLRGRLVTAVDNRLRAKTRDFYVEADPVTVRVTPPPAEGRPSSFFGLSGTNLTVDAQLSASACRVGDPLKLTLSMRGPVNWAKATAPDLGTLSNLTARFHLYGSTLQMTKTGDGRDFTFTLRPLEAGTYEIPPIPVSYFDSAARVYRTIQTTPIPLKVDPSSELKAGAWADPRQNENAAGESPSTSHAPAALRIQPAQPDALSLPWYLWLAAGPILFILRLLAGGLSRWAQNRKQASRPRQALSRALKNLTKIKTGDPRQTAEAAGLILRTYAADRLNREAGSVAGPEWVSLLRQEGAPEQALEEFGSTLDQLAEVAFSPAPKPEVETEILPRLPKLLRRLDEKGNGRKATGPAKLLVFLVILTSASIGARGQDAADFEWREAQSLGAKAADPADFKKAADRFERMAADGRRDGVLFYNLGTCRLLAGEPQAALAALVRAERYLGRPPDVVRNMGLARAALNGGESIGEPWDRTLLLFHYGLPWSVRLRIALAALGLFFLIGAATWRRPNRSPRIPLTLIALVFLLFGTSALVTWVQESQEEPITLAASSGDHHD